MKRNIVLIETAEGSGTGILYPCIYRTEKEYGSDYNSFIIFTNHHVLGGLGEKRKPDEDVRDFISLQIYDDNGRCIEKDDMKRVLIYDTVKDINKYNDIAALLVCINRNIKITLGTQIFHKELHNRDVLYMEGYPGVMLDDEVSQKVQLQGMAKSIYPDNQNIGVYQIKDDYHWYNDYKDLKLMQGFSGSPVYMEQDNQTFLLGMNQSIADIGSGENPFKLVYYLKMKHILEYLRESDCIIFQRDSEDTYLIEWIYGLEREIESYNSEPAFLLIGGSGAGKSSFAKDFAFHGENLHTTNDGQTTRTNVIYEYSLFCKQSEAEIKFMNKEKFKEHLWKLNGVKPVQLFFGQIFDLNTDKLPKSKLQYLSDCYYLIECIKRDDTKEKSKRTLENLDMLEEILIVSQKDKMNPQDDVLFDIYRSVIELFVSNIPVADVKFICNRKKVEEIKELYCNRTEYVNELGNVTGEILQQRTVFENIMRETWPQMAESGFWEILFKYCAQRKMKYKEYQQQCYGLITAGQTVLDEKHRKELVSERMDRNFCEYFVDNLFYTEGFFDINEFTFFMPVKDFKNKICNLIQESFMGDYNPKVLDSIYYRAHELIKDGLMQLLHIGSNLQYKIQLDHTSVEEENFLTLCLQEKEGKSLTGIIDYVKITDKVSNEYAMMLRDLKICRLKILDTPGLDHVEGEEQEKDVFHDIVYKYQSDFKIKLEDISVIYLKKLDSGRPDELRNILPYIWEVIPQTSAYCVFTGIDIFYRDCKEQISQIVWDKENLKNCPKSIQYILSDKGQKEITENIVYSKTRKDNLYLVLRNNLIPYCGRKDLVETSYQYYFNNLFYIRKLLSSVILKESSSLEIVDTNQAEKRLRENETVVERLLEHLFERASVRTWDYHHMTVRANYTRLAHKKQNALLGFWRTYRHQWNQLFHEAYSYVIRVESAGFVGLFEGEKAAVEAALAEMESEFLGGMNNLYVVDLQENKKNEFRRLLEKMYQHQEIYGGDNPFCLEKVETDYYKEKQFLMNVVDFAKGFKGIEEIRKAYVDFFIRVFIAQLKKSNQAKARNLVRLNTVLSDALEDLEKEFLHKYQTEDSGNAKNTLKVLLKYYLDISESEK